jgi:hypothetical protein
MASALRNHIEEFLASAVWRANPQYELVLYDRLPEEQQALLAELQQKPDFYGILRPTEGSGLSVKVVTRDTALLLLTLREPGILPRYARPTTPEHTLSVVRLILDQILQLQEGERFVAGADAYGLLYETPAATGGDARLQQLSISALQYGQALAVNDVLELSWRLYNYHRLPLSPAWRERFATPDRVKERLGIASGGRYVDFLDAAWFSPRDGAFGETASGDASGWLAWSRRQSGATHVARDGTYKLYVSPMPDFIENVFAVTLRALTDTAVLQFKIGADAEGLLRPDKMVAYFPSRETLLAAAEILASRLDGCPAHGVPFTSELAGDGLLSWGVDPPASQRLVSWQPQESWRLWLTNRLANALLTARTSGGAGSDGLEPWQYALERVALEGVDTASWTPGAETWR